jgi:hypothetical protein
MRSARITFPAHCPVTSPLTLLTCFRQPDEPDVWFTLLVACAVGALHLDEAVPLVEALRRGVHLERPQPQPVRAPPLGQVHEPVAQPTTAPGRVQVELLQLLAVVQDQKPDYGAPVSGNPGLVVRHNDVGDPAAHLRVVMRAAYGRQSGGEGTEPHIRDF